MKGNEENLLTRAARLAAFLTASYIAPGDWVIDATAGNGLDTVQLAKSAGPSGRVIAFDIQREAIVKTESRLKEEGLSDRARLYCRSHVRMKETLEELFREERMEEAGGGPAGPPRISAVMFNLGYLPGGRKDLTTRREETLRAFRESLEILREGGVLTAVLYDGHPEGTEEKEALLNWAETLDPRCFHAVFVRMLNQKKHPPEILMITPKKQPGSGQKKSPLPSGDPGEEGGRRSRG